VFTVGNLLIQEALDASSVTKGFSKGDERRIENFQAALAHQYFVGAGLVPARISEADNQDEIDSILKDNESCAISLAG
jgi:hypothetical protein